MRFSVEIKSAMLRLQPRIYTFNRIGATLLSQERSSSMLCEAHDAVYNVCLPLQRPRPRCFHLHVTRVKLRKVLTNKCCTVTRKLTEPPLSADHTIIYR